MWLSLLYQLRLKVLVKENTVYCLLVFSGDEVAGLGWRVDEDGGNIVTCDECACGGTISS